MSEPEPNLSSGETHRAGLEIRTVLLLVVALLLVGGLYMLISGKPPKTPASVDSTNAPQAPMYPKVPAASPASPPAPANTPGH